MIIEAAGLSAAGLDAAKRAITAIIGEHHGDYDQRVTEAAIRAYLAASPPSTGEPVAWLKEWISDGDTRRRVDLNQGRELWMEDFSETPLFASPPYTGEVEEALVERVARAIEPETFMLPRINLNKAIYDRAYARARAALAVSVPGKADAYSCKRCKGACTVADYVGDDMRCIETDCPDCNGTGYAAAPTGGQP